MPKRPDDDALTDEEMDVEALVESARLADAREEYEEAKVDRRRDAHVREED